MDSLDVVEPGLFDARQAAFLDSVAPLRPRLHRYCARMTGSAIDGEDVMQEAMFDAWRRLDSFDAERPLAAWLFGIAHNRCIDFLRRRRTRLRAESGAAGDPAEAFVEPTAILTGPAIERLVLGLPPKERACLLLKDVFDHSLEEIAVMVDSTIGGVKAALSRGRRKLAALPDTLMARETPGEEHRALLDLYVERFNRRDWDGVRALTSADARLRVADCFGGRLADSPYFVEYDRPIIPWRMVPGTIDGETAIIILQQDVAVPTPYSVIRLTIEHGRVTRIADYIKCPWVIDTAVITFAP